MVTYKQNKTTTITKLTPCYLYVVYCIVFSLVIAYFRLKPHAITVFMRFYCSLEMGFRLIRLNYIYVFTAVFCFLTVLKSVEIFSAKIRKNAQKSEQMSDFQWFECVRSLFLMSVHAVSGQMTSDKVDKCHFRQTKRTHFEQPMLICNALWYLK